MTGVEMCTFTIFTASPKAYDGLLAASTSSVSGTVTAINGDTATLDTSGVSLNYNSAHVLAANTISASGAATLGSFTGVGAGTKDGTAGNQVAGAVTDYSFSAPVIAPTAGSITPVTLGSTASITAAPKTYDGLLAASTSTVSGTTSGAING